ncbi:MAG: hypothetical protein CL912_23550 [Deltaproteobacteria bacterium]|nr:hypothetical protein [Deltaproteobacteria bacterium]
MLGAGYRDAGVFRRVWRDDGEEFMKLTKELRYVCQARDGREATGWKHRDWEPKIFGGCDTTVP